MDVDPGRLCHPRREGLSLVLGSSVHPDIGRSGRGDDAVHLGGRLEAGPDDRDRPAWPSREVPGGETGRPPVRKPLMRRRP